MTEVTLKTLASEIKASVDHLVQQFSDAGIQKSADDLVTDQEKQIILSYLNRENSSCSDQLMLHRKIRSTLNILGTGGKRKSIQIEVRRKRAFVKHDQQDLKQLVLEEKIPHVLKETVHTTKETIKHKSKLKFECEALKKSKREIAKIKKGNHHDEIIKGDKIYKSYFEEEGTKKHKKEIYRILEEKARHKVEIYEDNWNNEKDFNENFNNYHIITPHYVRQVEDDNDHELESVRGRNLKTTRSVKKNNKNLEFKADCEEARITRNAVRGNKGSKRGSGCSLQKNFQKPIQVINRDVIIGETITVGELANKMAIKGSQVIKMMMKMGTMVTINQVIHQEIAQLVAKKMGHKVILRRENDLEEAVMNDRDTGAVVEPRAPVVTIMGHVDHGKTSLLDYIRSTNVASKEAGGITQHIGAYHVETKNGKITFLDTPGHAAFTAMRLRGVQITDIVVLVIAANDGVMPQTVEAIQHAKAAKVPIIVAINKIDKPEADPNRTKSELARHGILPEEWSGEYQFICISAKLGIGIDELLDAILLQAEILELKAVRTGMASGTVIESFLDKGRGPIATVLVRKGTLRKGDIVLCGFEYGRVRAMLNEKGQEVMEAEPSIPVEIFGLSGVPTIGDEITVVRDEKKAREVALYRQGKFREVKLAHQQKFKLKNIFINTEENDIVEINIVLKADVQGSVQAVSDALLRLSTDKVKVKIIGLGVGEITETDATLAAASNAVLIGFNVRANASARRIIDTENLDVHYYSIIYNLIDEVKTKISSALSLELKQKIIGLAEVRNVFKSPKFGAVAGCLVTQGVIKRDNPIRILRNNIVIHEGTLESLRRFKDDINEVRNGTECGIGIKDYNDIRTGDMIEVFEIV